MELIATVKSVLHQSFAIGVVGFFLTIAFLAALELYKRNLTK